MKKQMIYALVAATIAAPAYGYNYTFINKTDRELGVSLALKGGLGNQEQVGFMQPNGKPNSTINKNFDGLKIGLCVDFINVGKFEADRKPVVMTAPVFEVNQLHYNEMVAKAHDSRALAAYMEANGIQPTFSVFGFCFNRTFVVAEMPNGSFIIITRAQGLL